MADTKSRHFVSTEWLAEHLRDDNLAIVDGSWYLPAMKRDGFKEYRAGHIPGAVYFDIDEIADHGSGLPHMLPPPPAFALHMRRLGISDGMNIVVYDGAGLFSAPRVWWTFRVFGAKDVFILDGGLPKWRAESRPLESGMVSRTPADFTPRFDKSLVADLARVEQALGSQNAQVVDVRPAERFRGEAPEPRAGVRSGHMPGSLNVPSSALVENGTLAAPDKIRSALAAGGVDPDQPVIASCGSGVAAAILWLALD
ncbi:MAG TPA: 3-mercaptopyruvate sulfurtransferase, partial [Xanthobacteraceae bacterium]|nr:3-mercaptopyruvate sulfurtransferase [Xanthobacteraceae bacterium]